MGKERTSERRGEDCKEVGASQWCIISLDYIQVLQELRGSTVSSELANEETKDSSTHPGEIDRDSDKICGDGSQVDSIRVV